MQLLPMHIYQKLSQLMSCWSSLLHLTSVRHSCSLSCRHLGSTLRLCTTDQQLSNLFRKDTDLFYSVWFQNCEFGLVSHSMYCAKYMSAEHSRQIQRLMAMLILAIVSI
jgi:hypothetical protein